MKVIKVVKKVKKADAPETVESIFKQYIHIGMELGGVIMHKNEEHREWTKQEKDIFKKLIVQLGNVSKHIEKEINR